MGHKDGEEVSFLRLGQGPNCEQKEVAATPTPGTPSAHLARFFSRKKEETISGFPHVWLVSPLRMRAEPSLLLSWGISGVWTRLVSTVPARGAARGRRHLMLRWPCFLKVKGLIQPSVCSVAE